MRKTTKLGKAPAIRAALGTAAALALAFALTGCDNPGGAPWTPVWMPPGPGLWVYGADAPVTGHAAVGSASVIANAINHAIAPANAGTRFVLAVGGNASMSSGFTMAAGTDLTIVSLTPGRAFNFSGTSGRLFTVGNGATLRLGNGLDVGGRAGHPNELIRVNSGGTLIMTGNSQITGHRNIGATTLANGLGAAVHVAHGGTLTMYGSSRIQANRAEGSHPNTNRAGGVSVAGALNMRGGAITGNSVRPSGAAQYDVPADVIIVPDGGTHTGTGIGQIVPPSDTPPIE